MSLGSTHSRQKVEVITQREEKSTRSTANQQYNSIAMCLLAHADAR